MSVQLVNTTDGYEIFWHDETAPVKTSTIKEEIRISVRTDGDRCLIRYYAAGAKNMPAVAKIDFELPAYSLTNDLNRITNDIAGLVVGFSQIKTTNSNDYQSIGGDPIYESALSLGYISDFALSAWRQVTAPTPKNPAAPPPNQPKSKFNVGDFVKTPTGEKAQVIGIEPDGQIKIKLVK